MTYHWLSCKQSHAPQKIITLLTAYDATMARLISQTDTDIILVGDSLGNIFQGESDTESVTCDHMVYHTKAVRNGAPQHYIIADMPFLTASISSDKTVRDAGKLIQLGRADAVKIEVISHRQLPMLKAVVDSGIAVMAHIGFTPQARRQFGGYKIQGRSDSSVALCHDLSKKAIDHGACALLLEMVPEALATAITQTSSVPVIGVGAGRGCDGQGLVTHDIIGLSDKSPSFAKQYCDGSSFITAGITAFNQAVQTGEFPDVNHCFKPLS